MVGRIRSKWFVGLLVLAWAAPLRAVLTEADRKDIAGRCFVWNEKHCSDRNRKADTVLRKSVGNKGKPADVSRDISKRAWLMLFQAKDPVTALHRFNQAVLIDPNNADAWRGGGTVYLNIGMHGWAEKLLRRSVEIDPNRADAHYSMGNWYVVAGKDYAKAEASYRQAIRLNPTFGDAHARLAQVILLQGRTAEARELATRAKALGSRLDPSFESKLEEKK